EILNYILNLLDSSILNKRFYNVIAPRALRPNSEYQLSVSIEGTSAPTSVIAIVRGTSHKGHPFSAQGNTIVSPFSSNIVSIQIGDIKDGDYRLEVTGSGGVEFTAEYPVDLIEQSYTVFVQTDRQVYQPGSKILFRVIALNPYLKPSPELTSDTLDIHVSDGSGNKVKEWRNIEIPRGVHTGEIQLGKHPVLGKWNITVIIQGQTYFKNVEVADYIYPKFVVEIDTAKHVTFKGNLIRTKINARTQHGRPIKGEATITIFPTIRSGVIQPIFQNPVRKVVPINGTNTVDFDIEDDLKLNDEYERTVIVDVVVEEFPTGRRQNNSVEVLLHKYDYQMDVVKSADYFKPGLKYIAYVKLSNHDGSAVTTEPEITVRHGYSRVDEVYEENNHKLDRNGIVKLEYITPANVTNTTALRIEAEYGMIKERMSPVPAAVSYSNTFLQILLDTERPLVNLDVEVTVKCTEPMRYLNYVVMGRGNVLLTNSFQVNNKMEYKIRFTTTQAMTPVCHLIVYYVREDGEFVGDAMDIQVEGILQNFIDLQVNAVESEPNLDVEMVVRAQQNSYVGILAVDEEVKMLRDGYDVDMKYVVNELKKYDLGAGTPYPQYLMNTKKQFIWKPGNSNPYSSIKESGANLLTNAEIDRHDPTLEDIYLRPVFYGPSTLKPDRGFAIPAIPATRPPLAGPYAFSRIPKPVWNKPKVYLTQDVAPTWLFKNFSSGYEGKHSIRARLPGTLGTWSITGFSLDPVHGLGLTTSPKKIHVSKPFMVTLDLPHSVQVGEILAASVVIHNNMNQDVNVEVTLHNPENKLEFAEISNEINATRKVELYRRKRLTVGRNSKAPVSFMIMPTKVGPIEIKVTANGPRNQDVVMKDLLVMAGGETEYYTKSVLLDLRNKQNLKRSVNFTIPRTVVPNSEAIEVSVVGSFLAPAMIHLDNLIRLPTGCGEQVLVHFMGNLIILQYLRSTRQLPTTVEREAISHLETSYQEELPFRREDGSFSPFASRDENGSVWLTAYVVQAFSQAKEFIYIDENVTDSALDWLVAHQGRDGSFYETGNILHEELQGNGGYSLALTAFVTVAMLEANQRNNPSVTNSVNKGLDYIARYIDESASAYTLALCSYALHLSKHTSKQSAFNLLNAKAKNKNHMKWWAKDFPTKEDKNPWMRLPRSIDIETTSYALLTYLEANQLEDAVGILDWLLNQQNSMGGFTSSHDTVVGLMALYKLVTRLATPSNMQVEVEYGKEAHHHFSVNKNNDMIMQSRQISKDAREVNITAQGSGLAVFRVAYKYNVNVTGPWPLFTLDPQVDKNSNWNHLQISICTAYVNKNLTDSQQSNMAVMEVTLPSGFTADVDSLPSLEVSQNAQKVETSHDLSKVIIYFNNITREEYCPTVSAYRTYKVAKQKPVPVIVYDYYDSSKRARIFYRGPTATLCDICDGEDCGDICYKESRLAKLQRDDSGHAASFQLSLLTLLLSLFITAV
ncbi:unnamed protein product, partial [Callosobruchus maculatus]